MPEADRSTHLQSSASAFAELGCLRNCSSVANIDSISMRTMVVRLAFTRTCCCSVGRNPASVTRMVYRPGASFALRKIPCVLVRSSLEPFVPAVSANSWSARAHLRRSRKVAHYTRQAAGNQLCLRFRPACQHRRAEPAAVPGAPNPELRPESSLLHCYLPGVVFTAEVLMGAIGSFTVNSALREIV